MNSLLTEVVPDDTSGAVDSTASALESGRGRPLAWPRLMMIVAGPLVIWLVARGADPGIRYALVLSLIYAIAVLGNNAITGGLGEINLAASAWMALGAYTTAAIAERGYGVVPCVLASTVVAGIIGFVVAIPTIRLAGLFTALVTFALAFSVPQLVSYLRSYTGGEQGKPIPYGLQIAGMPIDGSSLGTLLFVGAVFVVVGVGSWMMVESRWGLRVLWVGESQTAAALFGVRVRWVKIAVWTYAAALAGLSGSLLVLVTGYVSPGLFDYQLGVFLFVVAAVAGTRTVWGALLGGLMLGVVPSQVQSFLPAEATALLFGVVLFVGIALGRGGITRWLEKRAVGIARLRRGKS